jgi:hypothetical protein
LLISWSKRELCVAMSELRITRDPALCLVKLLKNSISNSLMLGN